VSSSCPPESRAAPGDRPLARALIFTLCIAFGWLGGFAWRERALIGRLWLDANEQRYLTMAGEVGPVTYVVAHADARSFADRALALDGVLGVEPYVGTRLSAIAFANAETPAIETVRALPGVTRVERRHVPMICH